MFRTDANKNPTAFTTDIAAQGGLILGVDYERGEPFPASEPNVGGAVLYTALLMGDPVQLTIRVIDKIGFQTATGSMRWVYANMPMFIWNALEPAQKRDVIGWMYKHEGGTAMRSLFPNWAAD
jgi:hypothetical protein